MFHQYGRSVLVKLYSYMFLMKYCFTSTDRLYWWNFILAKFSLNKILKLWIAPQRCNIINTNWCKFEYVLLILVAQPFSFDTVAERWYICVVWCKIKLQKRITFKVESRIRKSDNFWRSPDNIHSNISQKSYTNFSEPSTFRIYCKNPSRKTLPWTNYDQS